MLNPSLCARGDRRLWVRPALSLVVMGLWAPARAFATPQTEADRIGLGLGGSWWSFGVAARYNLSERSFLQGTLGSVTSSDHRSAGISLDYLLRGPTLTGNSDAVLNLNYGAGALIGGGESAGPILGLVPAVALEVDLVEAPLDVTIEYRPVLFLLPETDVAIIGLGLRLHYWF